MVIGLGGVLGSSFQRPPGGVVIIVIPGQADQEQLCASGCSSLYSPQAPT